MTLQKFLIAPYASGLQNDIEPWLLPEDAFSTLEDAFVFRGRLKKKFGYQLLGDTTTTNPQLTSRLRIQIGTTDGSGNLAATNLPGTLLKVGALFSCGDIIYTVTTVPAVVATSDSTLSTDGTSTGTVRYVSTPPDVFSFAIGGGQATIATTEVYFYPAEPVMGLITRENAAINKEETIAFDTQFAYIRVADAWERLDVATTWTGDNTTFMWGTNYRAANASNTNLYVTNFNFNISGATADPIRYLPNAASAFTTLRPQLNLGATRYLETGLIVLPFKDRLIVLNSVESSAGVFSQYVNRCRFSQNGDPTDLVNGWIDDKPGRGGFIDAPTKEAIVSAEFIKDKLIVDFETSTWELVYTANQILPFRWQKINTELGAESTFSKIPFDKVILSISNRGITACNGVDVQRVDEKIPDAVFNIHNGNNGPERVYGVRDYFSEVVYWSYPQWENNPTYPNRVLSYNYKNGTWAVFKDSFTCFGYYQFIDDTTWAQLDYDSWEVWNDPWNTSNLQSDFETIIAGNQQGYTVLLVRDKGDNDEFLQITDISGTTITSIDHNLETGDYVQIKNAQGSTGINDEIVYVTRQTSNTFTINITPGGTYSGGGTLKRISNPNIVTKRFNPFIQGGIGFNCPYIDFFVDKTTNGEFSVDLMVNESEFSVDTNPNAIPGTRVVSTAPYTSITSEFYQEKLWHRLFTYMTSYNLQFRFYLNNDQITDESIAFSNFVIHAMILYASPAEKVVG